MHIMTHQTSNNNVKSVKFGIQVRNVDSRKFNEGKVRPDLDRNYNV